MSEPSREPNLPGGLIDELTRSELRALRENWFWCVLFGIALLLLGMLAITFAFVFSLAFVMVFGFLALLAGLVQILSAFWMRCWRSFLLELLVGIAYLVIGGMILRFPDRSLEVVTLVIGAFILAGGIFRTAAALTLRFRNYGWSVINGALGIVLGLVILGGFPWSSEWVIGVFLGVELLFSGVIWLSLGLASRKLPESGSAA